MWRRLDSHAARPSRRSRRVIAAIAAVATFLAVVLALGFASGLFRPRLVVDMNDVLQINRSAHTFTYTYYISNNDWIDENVLSIASSDPDVALSMNVRGGPLTVDHGQRAFVTVSAKVRDCSRVRQGEPALKLQIDRTWGPVTETIWPGPIDPTRMKAYEQIFMDGAPWSACHAANDY